MGWAEERSPQSKQIETSLSFEPKPHVGLHASAQPTLFQAIESKGQAQRNQGPGDYFFLVRLALLNTQ